MKRELYKGRFIISFYDKEGENFLYFFDNVKEILKFQNKEITSQNIRLINVEIYRAIRRPNNICRFLNGKPMILQLCDVFEKKEYN